MTRVSQSHVLSFRFLTIPIIALLFFGSCEEEPTKRDSRRDLVASSVPCKPKDSSSSLKDTKATKGFNVRNGDEASSDEYRGVGMLWMNGSICTASLVCPNVVLTAGHCLDGVRTKDVEFHLDPKPGIPPRGRPLGYGEDTEVRYETDDLSQDIALIKLDRDVDGPFVDLAGDNDLRDSDQLEERLTVVGYGLNKGTSDANSSGSGVKRSGTVLFNLFLRAGRNNRKFDAGTFSPVGGLDDGRDSQLACAGDSGGPILTSKGDILGVVNTGFNIDRSERGISCETGDAVTFSLVKEHRDWIDETMEEWCSSPSDSEGELDEDDLEANQGLKNNDDDDTNSYAKDSTKDDTDKGNATTPDCG